jgi:hypothetical protein
MALARAYEQHMSMRVIAGAFLAAAVIDTGAQLWDGSPLLLLALPPASGAKDAALVAQ